MATTQTHRISSSHQGAKLLLLALVVGVALVAGRDFAHHIPALEDWISSRGWLGPVLFMVIVVVFTSVFVPDTVFAVLAGVLFGVAGGTLVIIAAALCTAAVNFAISRLFLHKAVCRALSHRPRLAAIHRAVSSEGVRFQFLLRLTPINPVVVSYVLGASETRFPAFLVACAGMIPTLTVEVYFGHAARHVAAAAGGVSDHPTLHTALTLAGLALCVGVLLYITRIARKALAEYEPTQADADNKVDTHPETPE